MNWNHGKRFGLKKFGRALATGVLLVSAAAWADGTHVGHPQPTATPAVDTGPAHSAGYRDGYNDGQREGATRGQADGNHEGRDRGFREGFDRCEREERERNFDAGYHEGFNQGERDGAVNGSSQGSRDGIAKGADDGESDGTTRADNDSNAAATPLGGAKGIDEANNSDAAARGQTDGLAAGDRDALAKAKAEDYARGRRDYRDERYAEPVNSHDEFAQRQATYQQGLKKSLNTFLEQGSALSTLGTPDDRFYRPNCSYPTAEQNNACASGYSDGYPAGFNESYNRAYREVYDRAFHDAREDGCRRARSGDYRLDYQRGYDNGRSEGYDRAYKAAYDSAYREMYAQKFRLVSDQVYQQKYNDFYNQHFEEARAKAYRERVAALYEAAFDQAHDAKFSEVYPKYADEQYRRGRADETEDFRLRPVRLTGASVVETIPNGVFEPGELIRVKVELRNFSDQPISGKDVKVALAADGSDVAEISQKEVLLSQNLNAKSVTTVTQVLEFRLTESHVGEESDLNLNVTFQSRQAGSEKFQLVAHYMLDVNFAEPPVLHEGMEGEIKVAVKNISQAASDPALRIRLSSPSDQIEITQGQAQIGLLNPGESRIVTFKAIGRAPGSPEIPIALEVNEASGRRVGLFDQTNEIPVLNDYTIHLTRDVSALRSGGIFRAEYALKNVSSRAVMSSLQLYVRIKSADAANFVVLGPNPQFLTPLMNGQTTRFVVPILVKAANPGGMLELEVKESGRTVVIHRANF